MLATQDVSHSITLASEFSPCQIARSTFLIETDETSDTALIDSIAAGDRAAMRTLYARHNVRVFRFALRIVSDEAAAEDVVSKTFLDVWRQAKAFEGRSQVSTWLLAIARHKALDMQQRGPMEPWDDHACESVVDTADNPETALQQAQRGSILLDCLETLSAAHREIIELVYYHQKSIKDVAEIIGVPRSTVKTRMFYARRKLAELLDARGITTALT